MNTLKSLALCGVFVSFTTPVLAQRVATENCRPRASIYRSSSSNTDHNSQDTALDLSAALDDHLVGPWSIRVDAGRTLGSTFQNTFSAARDTVSISRLTVGAIKSPGPCDARARGYVGASCGLYRYQFDRAGVSVYRRGINGMLGLDVMLSDRLGLSMLFVMSDIGGPGREPVASAYLIETRISAGITIRL